MARNNKAVRKNNPARNNELSIISATQISMSPIPPAEEMERYKSIEPNLPTKIIDTWMKQVDHRQNLEKEVIKGDIKRSNLGLVFNFILSVIAIITSFVSSFFVPYWYGLILAGMVVMASVIAHVISKSNKEKELYRKSKQRPIEDKSN